MRELQTTLVLFVLLMKLLMSYAISSNRPAALLMPNGNIVRSPINPAYHTLNLNPTTSCAEPSKESDRSLVTANFTNRRRKGLTEVQSRLHGVNNEILLWPGRHCQQDGASVNYMRPKNAQIGNFGRQYIPKMDNHNAQRSSSNYKSQNHNNCMQSGYIDQHRSYPHPSGIPNCRQSNILISNSETRPANDHSDKSSCLSSSFEVNPSIYRSRCSHLFIDRNKPHGSSNLELEQTPSYENEKSFESALLAGEGGSMETRVVARVDRLRSASSLSRPNGDPSIQDLKHENLLSCSDRGCGRTFRALPDSQIEASNPDGTQIHDILLPLEAASTMNLVNDKSIQYASEKIPTVDVIQGELPYHDNARQIALQIESPAIRSRSVPNAASDPSFRELPCEKFPSRSDREGERKFWAHAKGKSDSQIVALNPRRFIDVIQGQEMILPKEDAPIPLCFGNEQPIHCLSEGIPSQAMSVAVSKAPHGYYVSPPFTPLCSRTPSMPLFRSIAPMWSKPIPSAFAWARTTLGRRSFPPAFPEASPWIPWTPGPFVSRPLIVFDHRCSPLILFTPSVTGTAVADTLVYCVVLPNIFSSTLTFDSCLLHTHSSIVGSEYFTELMYL